MEKRQLVAVTLALAISASSLIVLAPSAIALSCAPEPDELSYEEMIDQSTTGDTRHPIMLLGVVAAWRDVGGRPGGGRAVARLAVGAHPVGQAPLVSDVRFWRDYPNVGSSFEFEFKTDGRYVVLARRMDDGTFKFDGPCGQTKRLNRDRFRDLLKYARQPETGIAERAWGSPHRQAFRG